MVHFNELRISPNYQQLIIDVSVLRESYYDDVYLDSIIIDNQDTYIENGPSSAPVYSYTIPDAVSRLTNELHSVKHARLVVGISEISDLTGLFFVYVRTKGTPAPNTPCNMDNVTTMRTVTNLYPFYVQAMNYIKEIEKNCAVPQNFIDYILRLKAMELSIYTGRYQDTIKYYNKFFNEKTRTFINTGGCSCGNS